MKNLMRTFVVVVLAADLFAIVYFAGHYMNTGQLLPAHGNEEMHPALAALAPDTAEAEENEHASKATAEEIDPAALLAAADPTLGQKVSNKCKACHTFDQGGPNKVGPNMWGIVGAKIAHRDDFSYTSVLAKMHEAGEVWTEEKLFAFLADPKAYAPGTKMAIKLRKPEDRANLIAFLNSLK
jgi:cytochrome c